LTRGDEDDIIISTYPNYFLSMDRIRTGNRPKRTLYIALGHDEEVLGEQGAGEIAKVLEQLLKLNNETLDFVLDEGLMIVDGIFPGVDDPIALVSVAEKVMKQNLRKL